MPSAEDAVYLNYVVQGFGVFLGVIAGTAVTLLVQYLIQYKDIQQQTKNLKFELELNVGKIDAWLDELGKYRNAVNGDALHNYFGYFDLSRTVSNTTSTMFISGRLYKKLTHDQIGQLQDRPTPSCVLYSVVQRRAVHERAGHDSHQNV